MIVRIAPIFAIVALVAGCAAPQVTPTSTHRPVTPTSSPTPSAMSKPGSRVAVGCDVLLPASAWQSLAGTGAVVDLNEDAAPTDLATAAQLQFGALTCVWAGPVTTSAASPGAVFTVVVAPDSKSQFDAHFAEIMADQTINPHAAATENVAGDESGYWCATDLEGLGADATLPICEGEMRVSDYWVSLQVDTVNALTRAQLTAGLDTAMTDIASKLTAADAPRPAWVAPANTPPAFCSTSASTASVRSIVGDPGLVAQTVDATPVRASTIGFVDRYKHCVWASVAYGSLVIDLLAGGSWVFPGFAPVVTGDSPVRTYSPATVPGASAALLGCEQGSCSSYLAVGTTLVSISFADAGGEKNVTELAAFAKAIAAN